MENKRIEIIKILTERYSIEELACLVFDNLCPDKLGLKNCDGCLCLECECEECWYAALNN